MSDLSPHDGLPDPMLGAALREALALPHDGAFAARVMARLGQADRGWDDVLAGWFWQGLAAAMLVLAVTGWATIAGGATAEEAHESVAVQLLDGQRPGSDVLLMAMAGNR